MGPEIDALERELARACSASTHAIAVSSGTDALLLALMALGIKAGDEVITTDVFVLRDRRRDRPRRRAAGARRHRSGDVQHRSGAGRRRRSRRGRRRSCRCTCSGSSADLDPILDAAPRRHPGRRGRGAGDRRRPTRRGRSAASAPSAASRSFPSKNLGAFGDAGLLTTNDDALARAGAAAAHARHGAEVLPPPRRRNFRMDALQAAVLRVKAPHLAAWTEGAPRERRALSRAVPRRRPRRARRRCRSSRRIAAHLQPVRDPHAPIATGSSATSTRAASATRSTIRCRSTCSRASPISAIGRATSRTPSARRARAWRFRSTAS